MLSGRLINLMGDGMFRVMALAIILVLALHHHLSAADIALHMRFGFTPHAGGTMSSGWQHNELGVNDGLNDINRSSDTLAVTTVEPPVGVVAAFETMFTGDAFYFKTGVWSLYTMSGGSGKTIDAAGTEVVKVAYSQWSVDVPVTFGVNLFYWGESRIYFGCGMAFAYGMSAMSFKSASMEHSAGFGGYAFPLVAELGCEYMTGGSTSIGCGVRFMYGRTANITSGDDYSAVDFTGFIFTLSASVHFEPGS